MDLGRSCSLTTLSRNTEATKTTLYWCLIG
jgi:hypothetical protein